MQNDKGHQWGRYGYKEEGSQQRTLKALLLKGLMAVVTYTNNF